MAKPAAVQKLKHGKALCGATFGGFVETFNWLVDFCTGLRGDGDDNGSGKIRLDRSLDDAPTIRNNAIAGQPSSGGSASGVWAWSVVASSEDSEDDDPQVSGMLVNCWANLGGVTRDFGTLEVEEVSEGILCAKFHGAAYTEVEACIYADIEDLEDAQLDDSTAYIVPLYVIDGNGGVSVDLRGAIQLNVFEPVEPVSSSSSQGAS